MNKLLLSLVAFMIFATSCSDNTEITPLKEDLSKPEQLEKDLKEIASREWGNLVDTIQFFNKEFIMKGRFTGIGPDGIYYSLTKSDGVIRFTVQDSVFVLIEDKHVRACNTDIFVEYDKSGTIAVTIDNILLTAESITKKHINVFYYGEPYGYIVWEHFENTDYTDGLYPVMHYYNDSRTFAFYENVFFFDLWKLIKDLKS